MPIISTPITPILWQHTLKGVCFLHQLEYIIGKDAFEKGLLRYFDTWKFKHPNANDVVRVFEKQSGLELDWYKEDFVNSTRTIDYAIESVVAEDKKEHFGHHQTHRPDGHAARCCCDLQQRRPGNFLRAARKSMRGEKPRENNTERTLLPDHRWVDLTYSFEIPEKMKKVAKVEIDPSQRMADQHPDNNVWEKK